MAKIFIDPGHGGSDPGALGNGFREADLTLKISLEIQRILLNEYVGAIVKLSRTTSVYLSLSDRANAANKWGADYFISIHLNAASASAKGYEDFVYNKTKNPKSIALQNNINSAVYAAITKHLGSTPNRGKKKANFAVLRETTMAAVLSENLFINSTNDGALIKKSNYVQVIARAHAEGIAKTANLKPKAVSSPKPTPAPAPKPTPASDELYRVRKSWADAASQKGAYKDKQNAIDEAKKHSGYKVFDSKGNAIYPVASNDIVHTVVAGDTLWGISQKYGVTVEVIKKANGLTSDTLSIGQKLTIKK